MGANTESSDYGGPEPPIGDLSPGPKGWETYRIRAFLSRVEVGEESETELPPPSDRERLVSDVLTALYGPPAGTSVPERFAGSPEAVEALRRQRDRRARRKRRAALERLARRFRYPIHPSRWRYLRQDAARELERRQEDAERRSPWWIRPDAQGEALRRAVFLALTDPRVQQAPVEELESRVRAAVQDSYAGDLTGPDWSRISESTEVRKRKEATERRVAASEALRLSEDPARAAELRMELERRREVVEARAELLTAGQRAVYLLVERDGLTPTEAASELTIAPATARKRLQRARTRLEETA